MSQNKTVFDQKSSFDNLVQKNYFRCQDLLSLSEPIFSKIGYTTIATMFSGDFRVEIRCGPSEYNAELFIYTANNRKWSLSDLIAIERVFRWLKSNCLDGSTKSRLEAEITCIFDLLAKELPSIDEFKWLLNRQR